ncbi:Tn3 family transposase [Streptomyces sp. NPDC099050]|uniref:Tn3 family transposase n=1 Tax=Streptomyces sp. NPDC099050 TaxID=3366100 RepID=UPI00381909DB
MDGPPGPPTTPPIPTWLSASKRCSASASRRASGTWPTSGSGARTCRCPTARSRPGTTAHYPAPLGAVFAEHGRIDETMRLLALVDPLLDPLVDPMDDTYRCLMNRQLTVQEFRHRLARAICHGGRGRVRQACREGQEDQLAAVQRLLGAGRR